MGLPNQGTFRKLSCGNCKRGHARKRGMHIPTQRKGMIPATPCDAIVPVRYGTPNDQPFLFDQRGRQWGVYVDGELLRNARGVGRAWATESAALRAGRAASSNRGPK